MKRKKLTVILVIGVISLSATVALASLSILPSDNQKASNEKLMGKLRSSRNIADADKVVAKVNGKPITKEVYKRFEAWAISDNEMEGKPAPTKEEVLELAAMPILLQQEAEDKGITVSEKEIDKEIAKEKADFQNATSENQQAVKNAYRDQGLDYDSYWNSKEHRKSVWFNLMIGKSDLSKDDVSVDSEVDQNGEPKADQKVFREAENHRKNLIDNAKIEEVE